MMDARDRMASALATTRAELILEAFDRRLESLGRRLEGLLALRDRLETVSEEVRAIRGTLAAASPPPAVAAAATRAAADAAYMAFENRYRGSREEIRERLADYVARFEGLAPVVDLGCGRGEFLELLRGARHRGPRGRGQRERGAGVPRPGARRRARATCSTSCGPSRRARWAASSRPRWPSTCRRPCSRRCSRRRTASLRPGGLLVLETVNPRSVVGLLEVYNRDLTHERPLHPDTLSFLAAAQGFTDVRVELRSPVDASSRLAPIPTDGLPERAAVALNENVERLNGAALRPAGVRARRAALSRCASRS